MHFAFPFFFPVCTAIECILQLNNFWILTLCFLFKLLLIRNYKTHLIEFDVILNFFRIYQSFRMQLALSAGLLS